MNELIAAILRASQHRFIGRLARDPELRSFESGRCVANARMAVNRPGAKRDDGLEPDWFKLELWGDQAMAFADGARKGQLVDVIGRVKSECWADRTTGEERTQLVIQVESWSPVGAPAPAPAAAAPPPTSAAQPPVWVSRDDIPF
jgi:single-strand DNA-binding protein